MTKKYTKKERFCITAILFFTLLFLGFLLLFPLLTAIGDATIYELTEIAVSRFLGGMIFLFLIIYLGYPILSPRRLPSIKALLVSLPALVIAINNFPILGLLNGTVWIDQSAPVLLLFVTAQLSIGFFEEIAFRGAIFPTLLDRLLKYTAEKEKPNAKISSETKAVFLSILAGSALFGAVHALNLFAGGDPVGVLMQIGYSFLIGGMCTIVLLKTRCIWFPVLIHTVYDCGGMLTRYVADGTLWDIYTVVLTIIVSVIVAIWFLVLLFRMKPQEIRDFLK